MSKKTEKSGLTLSGRVNFSRISHPYEYPNLLDIQVKSFQEFLQLETTADNRSNEGLVQSFLKKTSLFRIRKKHLLIRVFGLIIVDPPRYTIDECIERGLTYCVPLKAKVKACHVTILNTSTLKQLYRKCFLGNIPYMTA
jgi:DNA-directed RNA polymerase subunit beta